jgi:glycosyltransferase involved in cell wall biosynthesis
MKLCIVTHKVVKGDGQGRVNYEVAWEAISRAHQVTLLASNVAPELQQSDRVSWIYIPVKGLPTELLRNLAFSWRSGSWLRKHSCELDLVMVNGAITYFPADVNTAHFVHSSWLRSPVHTWRVRRDFYGFYQWFYTALSAHWEKQAFRRAKVIVAVSKQVEKELIDIGVPLERIRVILNGVDLQEFCPGVALASDLASGIDGANEEATRGIQRFESYGVKHFFVPFSKLSR